MSKTSEGPAIIVKGIVQHVTNLMRRKYAYCIINAEGINYFDDGYWISEEQFFAKYPIELESINRPGLDGRTNWAQ
jgi:hypothetical protein